MATKRKIKCKNCENTIIGAESFDELAKSKGWVKNDVFYVCSKCQVKPAVRPYVKSQKPVLKSEKAEENHGE